MWNNKTPEQIYLESHPEATLKDWIDYTTDKIKEERDKEHERVKNRDNWYKELIGRYIIIDFNGHSKIAGELKRGKSKDSFWGLDEKFYFSPSYQIFSDSNWNFKIDEERIRIINELWLNNPYEYNKDKYVKYKEISKEEFDKIVNEYNKAKEIFNTLSEIYTI